MPTTEQRRVVRLQAGWMLLVTALLAAGAVLTLPFFVMFSLLGFLVVLQFTSRVYVRPAWRLRLRWVLAAGVAPSLVFTYARVRDLLSVFPL